MATARGWDLRLVAALVGAVLVAGLMGRIAVNLRSSYDRPLASPSLDRGILLGLVVPIAVLLWTLEDRCAWLSATSCRAVTGLRAGYLAFECALAIVVATALAVTTPGQEAARLIFFDFLLLFALGVLVAVCVGARVAWVAPAVVGLACSTPGLLPLNLNPLVRADATNAVGRAAGVATAMALAAFIALDDDGLVASRRRRRLPGVVDE